MKSYEYRVRFGEGRWADGIMDIMAENKENAQDLALSYVCEQLANAFPDLDIEVSVEIVSRNRREYMSWNIEEMTGYKPITTFWDDFSVAEHFGVNEIRDTYRRAFEEWKGNYKYLTELVMVLNHKLWHWYERNTDFAKVYNELWEQTDGYACDNLKGDELDYFYDITD